MKKKLRTPNVVKKILNYHNRIPIIYHDSLLQPFFITLIKILNVDISDIRFSNFRIYNNFHFLTLINLLIL